MNNTNENPSIANTKGYVAMAMGIHLCECPFPINSNDYWDWRAGWIDAHLDSGGATLHDVVQGMEPEVEATPLVVEEEPEPKACPTPGQKAARLQELRDSLIGLHLEVLNLESSFDEEDFNSTRSICIEMKQAGRTVDAVKYYKARYHVRLYDAKNDVEAM